MELAKITPVASDTNGQIIVPISSDVLAKTNSEPQDKTWLGRSIEYPPVSFEGDKQKVKMYVEGCACFSLMCLIGGAITWGVCSDPNKTGCNQALHDAGEAFTIVGIVLLTLECCYGFCCLGALGEKGKSGSSYTRI